MSRDPIKPTAYGSDPRIEKLAARISDISGLLIGGPGASLAQIATAVPEIAKTTIARLLDQMQELGIVTKSEGPRPRYVTTDLGVVAVSNGIYRERGLIPQEEVEGLLDAANDAFLVEKTALEAEVHRLNRRVGLAERRAEEAGELLELVRVMASMVIAEDRIEDFGRALSMVEKKVAEIREACLPF